MKRINLLKAIFILFCLSVFYCPAFSQGDENTTNVSDSIDIDYDNPQKYEIADISINGARTLNPNALISISGLQVGDKIEVPGQDISQAIKKLWERGIIGDVSISADKIEDGKIYLSINLEERPRLRKFNLIGATSAQKSDLEDELELIRGRVLTDALVDNAKKTVKDFYIEKGFLNTEITTERRKDTLMNNTVVLDIKIKKNDRVKIQDIEIKGNKAFSDLKVKSQMKNTNEKVRFSLFEKLFDEITDISPKKVGTFFTKKHEVDFKDLKDFANQHVRLNIFEKSKFKRDNFIEDKEKIISFYNKNGYRDAEIINDTVYNTENDQLKIDLTVNEGNKYYFRNINWTGNYIYNDKTLSTVLGIKKGDVYNKELLDKRLQFNPTGRDVSSIYMDNGYLFFNVEPLEKAVADDSIDVEMRVTEGEQATIDEVIIAGNTRTNDHVVRREVRTLPGQKFSRQALIRTQRELSQLGYFDPEKIGINPIPDPQTGTVDIKYDLVERPSDQIELSGGWGGIYGFVGTVGVSFNNFSVKNIPDFEKWRPLPVGDGQKLSVRVQANGRQFQSYSASFSEPWLGGRKPNNFSISYQSSVQHRLDRRSRSLESLGSLNLTNIGVSLGRRVQWPDDYFTVSNQISYKLYQLDNFSGFFTNFSNGTSNTVTFETTISRNSLDNPTFPRKGSNISLNMILTPPYSAFDETSNYGELENEERFRWIEYHKWMFDSKFYNQLIGDLVIATRAHLGFIGAYNNNLGVGPFERFDLGGDGLAGQRFQLGRDVIGLRGYENSALTPDPRSGHYPDTQFQGGVAYQKYVMELRYPISVKSSTTIYVLGFLEGGNNYASISDFKAFDVKRSAGIGARIRMPAFGLLGFDWGYGFDSVPGTDGPSGAQFHFSIGQQIR